VTAKRKATGNKRTLQHPNFMKKVPKVLGTDAPSFRAVYVDTKCEERPCYRFPNREVCLMAMSYSYDLQAKVSDQMIKLEQQVATPAVPTVRDPRTAALIDALVRQDDAGCCPSIVQGQFHHLGDSRHWTTLCARLWGTTGERSPPFWCLALRVEGPTIWAPTT
jgi:hypothetical protein